MSAYDWRRTMRVEFNSHSGAERDFKKAQRASQPTLRARIVEIGGHRYVAYSAHELIAFESDNARPGHPG
jgi:hypothetical protein